MSRHALLLLAILAGAAGPARADPFFHTWEIRACRGSSAANSGPYIPGNLALSHTLNPAMRVIVSTNSSHGGGLIDVSCSQVPQIGATGGLSGLGLQAAWPFEGVNSATIAPDIAGGSNGLSITRDRVGGGCSDPTDSFGLSNLGQGFTPVDPQCSADPTLYRALSQNDVPLNDTDFTIEMWWKYAEAPRREDGTVASFHTLFAQRDLPGVCAWISESDGSPRLTVAADGSGNQLTIEAHLLDVNDTNRHHLAFRVTGGSMSILVDGVLQNVLRSPVGMSTVPYSAAPAQVYVGGRNNGGFSWCNNSYSGGIIDAVRVYNTGLTNGVIQAHFKNSHIKVNGDSSMNAQKSGYVCPNGTAGTVYETASNPGATASRWEWEFDNEVIIGTVGTNSYQFTAMDVNENIGFAIGSLTVDQNTMSIPPTPGVDSAGVTSIQWSVPTWFCDTNRTSYRFALTDYGEDFVSETYTTNIQTSKTRNETGLTPNTRYSMTAEAKYHDDAAFGGTDAQIGFSDPTVESFKVTLAAAPNAAPTFDQSETGTAVRLNVFLGGSTANPTWTELAVEGSRDDTASWEQHSSYIRFDNLNPAGKRIASGLLKSSRYRFRTRNRNLESVLTSGGPASGNLYVTQPLTPSAPLGNASADTQVNQSAPYLCPKTEINWTWPAVPRGSQGHPYTGTQANYRLRRHTASGALSTVASIASPGTVAAVPVAEHLEQGLSPGTDYRRRLDAEDPGASGGFTFSNLSSTGTFTTFPLAIPILDPIAPTSLSPTAVKWDWVRPEGLCPPFQYQVLDARTGTVLATLGTGLPLPGTTPRPSPTYTQTSDPSGALGVNQLASVVIRTIDNPPGFSANASPLSFGATNYTQANAPSGLSAVAVTTTTILLSWSGAGNPSYTRYELGLSATDFKVGVSSPVTVPMNHTAASKLLQGLAAGTTYYLQLRAINGRHEDSYGTTFTAETQLAVQTLTDTPVLQASPGSGQITWTWNSVAPPASAYELREDAGPLIDKDLTYVGSHVQGALGVNVPVGARIHALNAQGLSDPSPAVYAFTHSVNPTGPTVTGVSTQTISYSFGSGGNPAYTFYQLSVATDTIFSVVLATRTFTGTSYTVDGLFPGTTYYSRVRSISGSQNPSGWVSFAQAVTDRDPLVTLSTSPPSPYSISGNVVGLWHFDEGGGTKAVDSSVFANHGGLTCLLAACASTPTFTGGPVYHNGAASFSGQPGSLVRVPHLAPAYNFTGDVTAAAWARPATAAMPGAGGTILAKGILDSESFALDVFNSRFRFRVRKSGGAVVQAVSTQTVRVGQWDRVVGTYQASNGRVRVYVNGVLSSESTTGADTRATNSEPLSIGNRQSAASNWDLGFQGLIDEVRLVNGLYSPAQVAEDYAGSFPSLVVLPPPNDGVCLIVPPNAFSAPVVFYASDDPSSAPLHAGFQTLASGLSSLPTGQFLLSGSLIEIVPTVGGLPFTAPLGSSVTLCLTYPDANDDGLVDGTSPAVPASTLRVYTLDDTVVRWVALPSAVDAASRRVYAQVPHFSLFGLFGTSSIGANITEARVYPVPWKRGSGGRFDAPGLTFENLPQDGTLRIVTLAGRRVRDIAYSGSDSGTVVWDGNNDAGRPVASGVYFARVKSRTGSETVLKFAIER